MQVHKATIDGVLLLEPDLYGDSRGFFFESWNRKSYQAAGINEEFVQDNHSRSVQGVVRGLHYQIRQPQGKLVRVAAGRVLDVVVDLRKSSPTFGNHYAIELDDDRNQQLWIPPGLAHGFSVLSESADFLYKTTDYYAPEHERCIHWSDPDLAIDWKLEGTAPSVSEKDLQGVVFRDAEYFE